MARRLAAILAADAVGYSRLVRKDETSTLAALKAHREELIEPKLAQYHGRVVKLMGDGLLAEFPSVVEAVQSAVEIQHTMLGNITDIPDDRRITYRVGINVGDIVVESDDIYGDGVNVASRLEGLAEPGGICVARNVFDQVKDKLDLTFEHMGEKTVKNIAEPVTVYRVVLDDKAAELVTPLLSISPASARRTRPVVMAAVTVLALVVGGALWWRPWIPDVGPAQVGEVALPLPDKPSIAVLPFVNLSGDEEQEYFADGMTDDIITDLSKVSGLFVISRNSAFVFKGKAIKTAEVGRELGVRYVLEGSVRKVDQRVRITAQLVDTFTDGHLWAERYDRDLKDVFALQDEVTRNIVGALAVELTDDEQRRLVRKYTDNMEAYDYYLRGWEYFSGPTREANVRARQMHQRAIDLDPEFAAAYALLGFTYSQEWSMGWSQDPRSLELAFEFAERAIALDESLALGHAVLAEVYLWRKEHERAVAEQEKAIALSPNDADQIAGLGGILTWAGRPDRTIELAKKAMRLNPMYPIEYLWNLGHAYFLLGRHEEAIEALKRIRNRNPDYFPAHVYLAASYSELGWAEEARTETAEFKRLSPGTSVDAWRQRLPYKDQAVTERVISSLRKAGLK